jgi:hypothetical protein
VRTAARAFYSRPATMYIWFFRFDISSHSFGVLLVAAVESRFQCQDFRFCLLLIELLFLEISYLFFFFIFLVFGMDVMFQNRRYSAEFHSNPHRRHFLFLSSRIIVVPFHKFPCSSLVEVYNFVTWDLQVMHCFHTCKVKSFRTELST